VKIKSRPSKAPQNNNLKTSTSNFFYNIIIFLLGIIIVFLVYSLYMKIKNKEDAEKEAANKKLAAPIVQLEVLNGCGVSGVAEKFTDFLRNNNFDVVQTGNYISFDIDKSMVIDRTGNKENAIKVANALGIDHKNIIQQINNDYILDVSLIIGKDFNHLKPNNK
jgi:LytR cell envelope-related transcriptional attenuator